MMNTKNNMIVAALLSLSLATASCGGDEELLLAQEESKADFQERINLARPGTVEEVRTVLCKTKPSCDILLQVFSLSTNPPSGVMDPITVTVGDGSEEVNDQQTRVFKRGTNEPMLLQGLATGRHFVKFILNDNVDGASFLATTNTSCFENRENPQTNNTIKSASELPDVVDGLTTNETIHTWTDVDFFQLNLAGGDSGASWKRDVEIELKQPLGAELQASAWAFCDSGNDRITCDGDTEGYFSMKTGTGPHHCNTTRNQKKMNLQVACEGQEGAVVYIAVELAREDNNLRTMFPSLGRMCHQREEDNSYELITKVSDLW